MNSAFVHMQAGNQMMLSIGMLVVFGLVFYFLLIRPQQKRQREHTAKIAALDVGSRVMIGGGLIGTLIARGDTEDTIEIAPGLTVQVAKAGVVAEAPLPEDDDLPAYDPDREGGLDEDGFEDGRGDATDDDLVGNDTYREIRVERDDDPDETPQR